MLHLLLLFHQVIRLPDAYVNSTAAANPPPSTMDDSSIRHMLDNVMTVQVASGQLLVDVLTKPQALRAELRALDGHLLIVLWQFVTKMGSTYGWR